MQQLTNEEKAKVFAMYLGQHISHEDTETAKLIGVIETHVHFIHDGTGSYGHCSVNDADKLLLTPLSAITNEHAIEVSFISLPRAELTELQRIAYGKRLVINAGAAYNRYMYLISKGYDVSLFFGVGHWANGKTAIELGIANKKAA